MKQQPSPVPELNLAPKLRRPLSLWNPLDYLRLLYWVFYFPQAIRWYVWAIAKNETGIVDARGWQGKLAWFRENPIQVRLWFQSLILQVVIPLIIASFLQLVGLSISWSSVALGVAFGVALGVALGVAGGVAGGVALGVAFGVALGVGILRPENWFWNLCFGHPRLYQAEWKFPHITALPSYSLKRNLISWLEQDWSAGLAIVVQLQRFTLQFLPTVQAINFRLACTPPEQLIPRVALLASDPYDWNIVKYASASLNHSLRREFIESLFIIPRPIKDRWLQHINTNLSLESPARAVAAGYWFLFREQPNEASKAFSAANAFYNAGELVYGSEMLLIAQTLQKCTSSETLSEISNLKFPHPPLQPQLRPQTWQAITSLQRASEDIQVAHTAASASARAFASNRALGELSGILKEKAVLPAAERDLIINISESWRQALLSIASEVGTPTISQPVQNPFIIGDPVFGDQFVGRDDIMHQLEELWFMSPTPQSVVLYGHRRMGKTSILRNIATRLGTQAKIVYVNLNLCEIAQNLAEVLITISDEIEKVTGKPKPSDDELIKLPDITFRRYIKSLTEGNNESQPNLIIALDEFETLEILIQEGKITQDFIVYLRGLVQLAPKVAFAFAGLHTLEEMTADYFQPFFASVVPIRVGFLKAASTRQLLANPSIDYPFDFAPEVYEEVFRLTTGQPYLIQLIGFQLTRRYNTQVFEQNRPRDPFFTLEDLDAVIDDSDLFSKGRYYFTGVWKQAAEEPLHQQSILGYLAQYPEGQTQAAIAQSIGISEDAAKEALDTLYRHDVVSISDGSWCISVELFRRWLCDKQDC